jgi:predicted DNA-binding transcriptional regulator AlpA
MIQYVSGIIVIHYAFNRNIILQEVPMDQLIRENELQEILAISRTTVWRLRKSGIIKAVRHVGNRNYYRVSEIEAYLNSLSPEIS